MDKPKLAANQRFDLVDMTRLITGIDTGFLQAFRDVLGYGGYYSGGAGDYLPYKANMFHGFRITSAGGLNLTIAREYTNGGLTYEALAFDKDGYRVGGPRSATTKSLVFADVLTTMPIIARRVASNTTTETRQYYSASLGKYSVTGTTETVDDWEVDLSRNQGVGDVFAANNTTLRDAGWIDIGTVAGDGAGGVSTIVDKSEAGNRNPEFLTDDTLSWAAAPAADDSVRRPTNLAEAFMALRQLVARMRWGTSAGAGRLFDDRPTYDAAFEEEGGIRFAGGETAIAGLQNSYIRAIGSGSGYDLLVATPNSPADADDFNFYRALGFLAGGASSNQIDPANAVGFCYSNDASGKSVIGVEKNWNVSPIQMCPQGDQEDPWAVAASTHNVWYLERLGFPPRYIIYWDPGALNGMYLFAPIYVPDGTFVDTIDWDVEVQATFPSDLDFQCGVRRVDKTDGSEADVGPAANTYNATSGTPWDGTGVPDVTKAEALNTANGFSIDNATYSYVAWCRLYDNSGVAANTYIHILGLTIKCYIREASHVY